jgi:hypothetical protein
VRCSFAKAIRQLELFVRQLVKLNTPNSQGQTHRKTLENARKHAFKNGKSAEEIQTRFAELEPIKLEPGTEHVIAMFDELSNTRARTKIGPMPITHVEIQAYCHLTGTDLDPWELDALKRMDNAYIHEAQEFAQRNRKD